MARKAIYTKALGEAIAQKDDPTLNKGYHVVRMNPNKWAVTSAGSVKAIRVFTTQEGAINFAKQNAFNKTGVDVFVHGIDGRVQERISAGQTGK